MIVPVILAAGDSARMGFPKALLPFCRRTFLSHILETLKTAGLNSHVIVLGRDADRILKEVDLSGERVLVNPDPSRGQLSSMQLAISEISIKAEGCMFWPVDQPDVSTALVRNLIGLFRQSGASIAMPVYGGKRGHPAIFSRGLFQEFLATPVEEGPKRIVTGRNPALLECDEPGTVIDIDTPADYFALTGVSLENFLRSQRLCGESVNAGTAEAEPGE
jgi:molybdenum cofactor cytidylyltransferase